MKTGLVHILKIAAIFFALAACALGQNSDESPPSTEATLVDAIREQLKLVDESPDLDDDAKATIRTTLLNAQKELRPRQLCQCVWSKPTRRPTRRVPK